VNVRAADTKARILEAAVAEFSKHGIAGARVDRITTQAGVNNSLLFRYFGSKAQLFDAVFDQLAGSTVEGVPFDPTNLAEYAGRLFDYYEANPDIVRLSAWYQLERTDDSLPVHVLNSHANKVSLLAEAQRSGLVSSRLPAEQLLNMIIHLSVAGTGLTPVLKPADRDAKESRESIVSAVQRLVAV
jgi:AcrR family transcriptional regulator